MASFKSVFVRRLFLTLFIGSVVSAAELDRTKVDHGSEENGSWLSWVPGSLKHLLYGSASTHPVTSAASQQSNQKSEEHPAVTKASTSTSNEEDQGSTELRSHHRREAEVKKFQKSKTDASKSGKTKPNSVSQSVNANANGMMRSEKGDKHTSTTTTEEPSTTTEETTTTTEETTTTTEETTTTTEEATTTTDEPTTTTGGISAYHSEETESYSSSYTNDGHRMHGFSQQVRCVNGDCEKVSKNISPAPQGRNLKETAQSTEKHFKDASQALHAAQALQQFDNRLLGFGRTYSPADEMLGREFARQEREFPWQRFADGAFDGFGGLAAANRGAMLARNRRAHRSNHTGEIEPQVHSESSSFESSYVDDGHGAHGQAQKVSCVDGDCAKVSETLTPRTGDHKTTMHAKKSVAHLPAGLFGQAEKDWSHDLMAGQSWGREMAREHAAMESEFAQQEKSAANAIAHEDRVARGVWQNIAKEENAAGSTLQNLLHMNHAAMRHHNRSAHDGQPQVHSESSSFESSYVDDGHGARGQEQKVSCVDGDCMKVSEVLKPADSHKKGKNSRASSSHPKGEITENFQQFFPHGNSNINEGQALMNQLAQQNSIFPQEPMQTAFFPTLGDKVTPDGSLFGLGNDINGPQDAANSPLASPFF